VRDEVQKCLNLPSDMPVEVMETGTKLLANTNDEHLVNNQGCTEEGSTKMFQWNI
jgi:hypothetical protein